ncbi:hypothetical protein BGZ81_005508, partial [Podila clonocystis]
MYRANRDQGEEHISPMIELEATRTSAPTTSTTPADIEEPTLHSNPSYSSDLSDATESSTQSSTEKRQLVKPDSNTISEQTKSYDPHYQPAESDEESDVSKREQVPKDEQGHEISPIAEVAAVVSNTDDPSMPCMTFRFWIMGLVSILALAFINQ